MPSSRRTVTRGRRLLAVVFLAAGILGAAASEVSAAPADHLVLSEIVVTANRFGAKYVEIVNPTGATVALDGVAITNGTNTGNGAGYWRLAEDTPTSLTAGGGTGGAFHGAFPAGATMAAGDTLVVAITGSGDYLAAYGVLPDYEMYEDGAVPDDVPELVEVFPGSIAAGLGGGTNSPGLSDVAGSVMLYQWDGTDDLVEDLDYFHWGTNDAFRVDKTGVTIGAGTYLADTDAATQRARRVNDSAGDSFSFGRMSDDEGTEATPGNGATGHDETSESLVDTWEVDAQTPPAPPASHHPAAPIVVNTQTSPSAPLDGQLTTVTVEALSAGGVASMTLHYAVDGGSDIPVTGIDAGGGEWTAQVPAQTEGAVITWWVEITGSNGAAAVHPSAAPRFSDSWTTGPPFVPGEGPDKLLMTEVCVKGTEGEFVEIYNPNDWDVDLSDYYLTDAVYNAQGYWRMGNGILAQDTIGGGDFYDFHSRFPAGFSIDAGDTIVVSIAGSQAYSGIYGYLPDLELFEDDVIADAVPDMRWVFGDANSNSIVGATVPSMTNGGESVTLYQFTQGEALTTDIDMFAWGGGGSYQVNKTGVTVAGSTYLPDTSPGSQRLFTGEHDFGYSYQRVQGEDGNQTPSGSNGVDGRDETSENWAVTFTDAQPVDPSRPGGGGSVGGGSVELRVPAATFLPTMGEVFPVRFVARPRSETKVRIYDLEGRHVITLFDSRFDGSASTVPDAPTIRIWDGRDDRYELMKAGMYIVHLSVVDQESGDEETQTAPVVLATRLSK